MRSCKPYLLAVTLIVVACAGPTGTWMKNGVTPLQFDQDNYACLQESQQPFGYQGGPGWGPAWGGFNGYSGVQTNQELYSACMKARAYYWQPSKPGAQ